MNKWVFIAANLCKQICCSKTSYFHVYFISGTGTGGQNNWSGKPSFQPLGLLLNDLLLKKIIPSDSGLRISSFCLKLVLSFHASLLPGTVKYPARYNSFAAGIVPPVEPSTSNGVALGPNPSTPLWGHIIYPVFWARAECIQIQVVVIGLPGMGIAAFGSYRHCATHQRGKYQTGIYCLVFNGAALQ